MLFHDSRIIGSTNILKYLKTVKLVKMYNNKINNHKAIQKHPFCFYSLDRSNY